MYSAHRLKSIAAALVRSCQGPELHRQAEALARHLKRQGGIQHLSDLKREVSRQAIRFGRSGRRNTYSPDRTASVAHSLDRTREVQVLDLQGTK